MEESASDFSTAASACVKLPNRVFKYIIDIVIIAAHNTEIIIFAFFIEVSLLPILIGGVNTNILITN